MHTQSLGFEVRLARTAQELEAACLVRAVSYGHHLPHLQQAMAEPDLLDADENTTIIVCVDKASGVAIGTARIQTNVEGPLLIEHSLELPEALRDDSRAEITRFSAIPGADPLVKISLMKASYLVCIARQVRWMVIGARNEALIRQYRRLGFESILGSDLTVPLLHAGRLQHVALAFNVTRAESTWRMQDHPLYTFMIETVHPDIRLFSRRAPSTSADVSTSRSVALQWMAAAANSARAAEAGDDVASRRGRLVV